MLVEQDVLIDGVVEQQTFAQSRHTQVLAGIPLERPSAVEALLQRCRDSAKFGQWADVERIASSAAMTYPDEPSFHTQWAWAVHRQGSTVEALYIVEKVAQRFPKSVAVAYTSACLYGALRRSRDAKRWLDLAIQLARNPDKVKLRSLSQPELQSVWTDEH